MANKQAKKALEQIKMQSASEVGVNLNQGYNGDLTARQAGSIGGQMVKKMIESYENGMTKYKGNTKRSRAVRGSFFVENQKARAQCALAFQAVKAS